MNRQKEYTEEGRYTPISKAEGGSSKTYKAVWFAEGTSATRITLKVDDIDGIGTVYTNEDAILGGDSIALTYGEEAPTTIFETGLTTVVTGGPAIWINEFDGGEGILPLYLQTNSPE